MKVRLVLSAAAALALVSVAAVSAANANDDVGATPPTTDFHTVVTEPGGGGGGGPGASADSPHQPVCVWERGGASEVDTVARNSGVGAAIIREDAQDHILLVYRCDGH